MKIDAYGNKLVVEGNIKSISHYDQLKSILDKMLIDNQKIIIELIDSISITSSVIGYLSKLVHVDGIVLKLVINDEDLFNLFDDLGLSEAFNVQKLYPKN